LAESLNEKVFAPGLGDAPKSQWPSVTVSENQRPIDILRPQSKAHDLVLNYLKKRIDTSEHEMQRFYARWQHLEKRQQAYINLPDWEKELEQLNEKGEPPKVTRIVIPYSFATIQTIVTFLLHSFAGRRPIFQVGSWKDETIEPAQMMEQKLQYDADHSRLITHLHNFLQDGQTYGVGALMVMWSKETAMRTRRKKQTFFTLGGGANVREVPVREPATVYEGNQIRSIDPYMFFPDPRVPMTEVNKRGEFVFWRSFEGRHALKAAEAPLDEDPEGSLRWVDHIPATQSHRDFDQGQSSRGLRSGGIPHPGRLSEPVGNLREYIQIDQGTIKIIPQELGLGPGTRPEMWIFSIGNGGQIIQAEPFTTDHGMHPVCVAEPYTAGYGFGHLGMADYLGPLQDTVSWFFNSHIDNVRKVLNDMMLVDPSMVELQDLKNPEPGKLIRLKRAAHGQDVRSAVQQLAIQDVTAQHVGDANEVIRIGQLLSSVSDNILGVQDEGGRKTATEVRTSGQAAASRLASQARVISSQAIVDLTTMMGLNNQQFLSEEFYMQVVGQEGAQKPLRVTPDQLVGDFYYPVHDGTLPIDRVAMLDIWKELMIGVLQDQELRQTYSIPKLFEHVAELGGARNIQTFRTQVLPDGQVDRMAQAGNIKEKFWGNLESGLPGERLDEDERQHLMNVLESPSFKKALRISYVECRMLPSQILATNLSSEGGVAAAVMLQGKAAGWVRAFESILELLDEPEES
jgi:hypothetical protein